MRHQLPALLFAAAFVAMLSACETRAQKNPVITTGVVNLGPAANFPAGTVNTNFQARYGIVVVNSGGTPFAILPQCTHDGATLKWNPETDQFICPKDGSRFDILGRVTRGPATAPLRGIVPDRQADGTLTVDLSKLYNTFATDGGKSTDHGYPPAVAN